MSELQISLAVVGGIVVLAVLAYNRIQERRYRKQAESTFRAMEQDPLMDARPFAAEVSEPRSGPAFKERQEPQFDDEPDDLAGVDGVQEPRFGDHDLPARESHPTSKPLAPPPRPATVKPFETPRVVEKAVARQAGPEQARVAPTPPCSPHEQVIEYRIQIRGEGILASAFADAVSRSRALGKQVRWHGYPVKGSAWEELRPWSDIHYREIMVGMQLADRNGSVSEEDISALCAMVRDAAEPHGLKVACEDFAGALERAQALDLFCVDVDVLIGLNVVARGEENLPMQLVRREAEMAGMVLAADGTYQLQDRRGEILYSLCNHESTPFSSDLEHFSTHGVTLLFDVPRVPDGLKIFDTMVALGRKLASEIGGLLVDDNLRPLTDVGIERIRQQLGQIYGRMETKGIPAGGDLALRVFS
jgi:FtsZ-interacting cell division protein ZipA